MVTHKGNHETDSPPPPPIFYARLNSAPSLPAPLRGEVQSEVGRAVTGHRALRCPPSSSHRPGWAVGAGRRARFLPAPVWFSPVPVSRLPVPRWAGAGQPRPWGGATAARALWERAGTGWNRLPLTAPPRSPLLPKPRNALRHRSPERWEAVSEAAVELCGSVEQYLKKKKPNRQRWGKPEVSCGRSCSAAVASVLAGMRQTASIMCSSRVHLKSGGNEWWSSLGTSGERIYIHQLQPFHLIFPKGGFHREFLD